MKICVAQTKSVAGEIQHNIENHKKLIEKAIFEKADMIVFPELSLTGYEPTLAKKVATTASDSRLDIFQSICDVNNIVIGVGIPTKSDGGIHITMVLFQPGQERRTYSKKYLHSDEDDFFVSGANFPFLIINSVNIGIAICYEISVPQHAEDAAENGVKFYIASVAKFSGGIEKALKTLQEIACKYRMTVLMSNCVGVADGHVCAGRSSIWNDKGNLLCQLDDANEGIIVWDTNAREFRIF